jgi:hypothetical protein
MNQGDGDTENKVIGRDGYCVVSVRSVVRLFVLHYATTECGGREYLMSVEHFYTIIGVINVGQLFAMIDFLQRGAKVRFVLDLEKRLQQKKRANGMFARCCGLL